MPTANVNFQELDFGWQWGKKNHFTAGMCHYIYPPLGGVCSYGKPKPSGAYPLQWDETHRLL